LVDKIKITPDSIVVRDNNNNVTFDTNNIYLKTNANGRMTMGGWRRLPVFAGQYAASVSTYVPEDHKVYGHCMTFMGAPGIQTSGNYLTGDNPVYATGSPRSGEQMDWYAYAFYAPANVTQWYMHAGPYQSSWDGGSTSLNRLRHYMYSGKMKIYYRSYWDGNPNLYLGVFSEDGVMIPMEGTQIDWSGWELVQTGNVVLNYVKTSGTIRPTSVEPDLLTLKNAYKLKGEGYYIVRYEDGYRNVTPAYARAYCPITGMEDSTYYATSQFPRIDNYYPSSETNRLAGNSLDEWSQSSIESMRTRYGQQYGYWFPVVLQQPMNISVSETP
jgi:hypothetical protein